ncbi:MAG: hypothetical protein ABII88_08085 [Candidatus Omnitrophota bacterium]
MKAIFLITIFLAMILLSNSVIARDDSEIIPDGMQIVEVSRGTKLLVPQDAKVSEQGGLIVVEKMEEYVARIFFAINARLEESRLKQEQIEQQVSQLKAEIIELKDKQAAAQKKEEELQKKQAQKNTEEQAEQIKKQGQE